MWKFSEVSSPWEEPCEMWDRKELGKIFYFFPSIKTPVFLGFPCGSADKKSVCNVGDLVSIPGLERSPGAGKGYPLQYCHLENSMDCIVRGVTKSWTWLSDFHFHQDSKALIPFETFLEKCWMLCGHTCWMICCVFLQAVVMGKHVW